MSAQNKLVKYKNNFIKRFIDRIFSSIANKFLTSRLLDKSIEDAINLEFPDELQQKETKKLLEELLSRNHNLLETLNIKMLRKNIVELFGKSRLERIVNDSTLQDEILELSEEELQTYYYILNYKTTDFNERISNLSTYSCKNINLNELKKLPENERLKVISIIVSNSQFYLGSLSELNSYYENRKAMCQQIISNPKIVEEEYKKNIESEEEISDFPFGLLYEMQSLNELDRIRYAIIEAKYGMSIEKADVLCSAFGQDCDKIKQSEETRVITELKNILEETNVEKLRQISLDEVYANYSGTINIFPNLKNAYLQKYQENLYKINEKDYIGSQSVKIKGRKKAEVKIYNVLGKDNDRSDFNMILTSLGGIYYINHNYEDLRGDWDRQDKNHTISCSYIGNDFLGVVDETYLLAFSDIKKNELLQARNQDAGTVDDTFERWEDLEQNKFLIPQNQINSSKVYNELLVERKIEKDGKLINRKPTFAVFIAKKLEDIEDKNNFEWNSAKRLAASLDIPIAVIDGTQCTKLEFAKVKDMVRAIKEEHRIELIPNIIHKIENNRAAQIGKLKDVRNQFFSNQAIKRWLEEIIGAIITSDTDTFNQGIEEFIKVTKDLKKVYSEHTDTSLDACKTYNYDDYINRLKILYSSRNRGNSNLKTRLQEKSNIQQRDNNGEIEFN